MVSTVEQHERMNLSKQEKIEEGIKLMNVAVKNDADRPDIWALMFCMHVRYLKGLRYGDLLKAWRATK